MRAWIQDAGGSETLDRRDGGKNKDDERKDEHNEHRHLHVVGFDLLAEVLRGAADHQTGDKDCEHDVDQHAVHAGADTAKNNLAEHDVVEGNQAAEGSERVVPAVNSAATGIGGDGRPKSSISDAEADLLPFHVSAGLQGGCVLVGAGEEW